MKDEDGNRSGSGRKQSSISQTSTPVRERPLTRNHEEAKLSAVVVGT